MRNIRIGSLSIRTGSLRELLDMLPMDGKTGPARSFGYLNPHVYNLAASDRRVGAFLEGCDFVCLDGIGIALAGRLCNRVPLNRLVMDQVFDMAVREGRLAGRALLLGLSPEENAAAAAHLQAAAPGLDIAVGMHGFLETEAYAAIFREHADVDYVLAGMGSPKSEAVLDLARGICVRARCWHVGGGTLRNWAGTKRRAPKWVSRAGMEWAHRMAFEPETRERYLRGIPAFARNLVRDHRASGGR